MIDALDTALGMLATASSDDLVARVQRARAELLDHAELSDDNLERCLLRAVKIALESARQPAAQAASFEVARTARATMDARAPTGMLKVRALIAAVFEAGEDWDQTKTEATRFLSLLESLDQPPSRMQISVLCHALWKLESWRELEAWSTKLLHEAQRMDDWRSELLALEQWAYSTEALGRPAHALQARERMLDRLRCLGKDLTGPMSLQIVAETERLRAVVATLSEREQ